MGWRLDEHRATDDTTPTKSMTVALGLSRLLDL